MDRDEFLRRLLEHVYRGNPLMGERMLGIPQSGWTGDESNAEISQRGYIPPSWYKESPRSEIRDILPNTEYWRDRMQFDLLGEYDTPLRRGLSNL